MKRFHRSEEDLLRREEGRLRRERERAMIVGTMNLLNRNPIKKRMNNERNVELINAVRNKVNNVLKRIGLNIKIHSFESRDNFAHKEGMTQLIERLLMNGVKDHCGNQSTKTRSVGLGCRSGEGAVRVSLSEGRRHTIGLEASKVQSENGCGLRRNLAKESLEECLLPDTRNGKQTLSNRQFEDGGKIGPCICRVLNERKAA